MGTNTDISAFLANGGSVTSCATDASGKAPKGTKPATKPVASKPATVVAFDTSDPNWKWNLLSDPKIAKAIKRGVFSALIGSGWSTKADQVEGRISEIRTILATDYLDKFDASKGKGIAGYCRMVAHTKTVSYIKLHLHINDGAVNRGTVNHTDFTSGENGAEENSTPSVGIHADDSATLAFARVEQRERLERAMTALSDAERAHFMALMSGRTSADWASENGYSAVQANRQKTAMIAKLERLVTADDE